MFKKFFPKSPDPSINTGAESTNAKFGHLNELIEYINNVPPGSGIASVTGSAVDNTDPLNPVVNIPTGYLPLEGGTMDNGATINFNSGARLQEGTTDAGIGGNGGIALRCSIDYELKWEAGRLFVMEQDGFIIREVRYTGISEPTGNDDVTKGFVQNSRWVLDSGVTYVCIDPTENAAIWEIVFSAEDCIPLAGTQKGVVTGDVIVDTESGGRLTLAYPNGDAITLGTEYSTYSAISFYNGTSNETVKLYLRGGDLYLINEDTEEGIGGLISTINGINNTRVVYFPDINTVSQGAFGLPNYLYHGQNGKQYLDNGIAGWLGYTKLPSHYFIDSCSYTQSGTSAPTVITTFETQVEDFGYAGIISKSITYVAVGQYRISYQGGSIFGFDPYVPTNLNKVKVIMSPGKAPLTILSYDVNFTSVDRISVDIFVRQSTTGNLVNNALTGSVVDVYFYR